MSDKESLNKKTKTSPQPKHPFFSSTLSKKNSESNFSLMGSSVPDPIVSRTEYGISAVIYFEKDSFLLTGNNLTAVQKLSAELQYLNNPGVTVSGHSSMEGSAEHNMNLSNSRRFGVISMLDSSLKISSIKYEGEAFGETQPAVEETGKTESEKEDQRKYNRRVEITILFDISSTNDNKEKAPDLTYHPTEENYKRWDQEDFNRKLWETPNVSPNKEQSFNELLWKKFDETVDKALKKLNVPEKLRPFIKKGARSAIEKGVETILNKTLDQTGLGDTEKKAIKKAIEAAGKTELFPE